MPVVKAYVAFAFEHRVSPEQLAAFDTEVQRASISTVAPKTQGATEVIQGLELDSEKRDASITVAEARSWLRRLDEERKRLTQLVADITVG